jgi:hypothetical protein
MAAIEYIQREHAGLNELTALTMVEREGFGLRHVVFRFPRSPHK